tara:strand:- start:289 stop:516 length:228 start_codon:yes stop_codon:yes gene_type:complete
MRNLKTTIFASILAATATGAMAAPVTPEIDLKDPSLQELVDLGSTQTQMNKYELIDVAPKPTYPDTKTVKKAKKK